MTAVDPHFGTEHVVLASDCLQLAVTDVGG